MDNTKPDTKQVLIVTGASRGIGAATCRLAAERGYSICVNYRSSRAAADTLVAELLASGCEAFAHAADISHESEVMRLFAAVDERLGRLTALVNNAGILEKQMRLDEIDRARLTRVFDTNVVGTFLCTREAIRRMSTKHGGHGGAIVNVSSLASRLGAPGEYIDYAASKGAVDSMTRGLAQEVAAEGIRVNCVRPGAIYTDIHASGGEPNRVERVKHAIPMRRGGLPEEVAAAILWLLSTEASYTTGSFIEVTGGK